MVIANILVAASIEVPHLMILLEILHPHSLQQKKEEGMQSLESKFKEQSETKSQLESKLTSLRCQIMDIKNEALKHAHHADGRVGQQLAQIMRQIIHIDSTTVPRTANAAEEVSPSHKPATPLALHEPLLHEQLPSILNDTVLVDSSANARILGAGKVFHAFLKTTFLLS